MRVVPRSTLQTSQPRQRTLPPEDAIGAVGAGEGLAPLLLLQFSSFSYLVSVSILREVSGDQPYLFDYVIADFSFLF